MWNCHWRKLRGKHFYERAYELIRSYSQPDRWIQITFLWAHRVWFKITEHKLQLIDRETFITSFAYCSLGFPHIYRSNPSISLWWTCVLTWIRLHLCASVSVHNISINKNISLIQLPFYEFFLGCFKNNANKQQNWMEEWGEKPHNTVQYKHTRCMTKISTKLGKSVQRQWKRKKSPNQ